MHQPTDGPPRSGSPRAESLAARLAALTGNQPQLIPEGVGTRIEIELPPTLSRSVRRSLLVALADADQCGHGGGYVWAEIRDPLPDPARLNPDQRAGYACALCGEALYTSRFLGSADGFQLWACSPLCPTASTVPMHTVQRG